MRRRLLEAMTCLPTSLLRLPRILVHLTPNLEGKEIQLDRRRSKVARCIEQVLHLLALIQEMARDTKQIIEREVHRIRSRAITGARDRMTGDKTATGPLEMLLMALRTIKIGAGEMIMGLR